MDEKYHVFDSSGDVGLTVYGGTLEELFANAATGLFHLISPSEIEKKEQIYVEADGTELENLFVKWLNELIYLFDAKGFIGSVVEIKNITDNEVKAAVHGDSFDEVKYEKGVLVKAATYHNLIISRQCSQYVAKVIFDI